MSNKKHIVIKENFRVSPSIMLPKGHVYAVQYWVTRQKDDILDMPVIDIGGKFVRIPPEYYESQTEERKPMKKCITIDEARDPKIVDQNEKVYIGSRRTGRKGHFSPSFINMSWPEVVITYEPIATDGKRVVESAIGYFDENYTITDYTPAATFDAVNEDSPKSSYVDSLNDTLEKMRERSSILLEKINVLNQENDNLIDAIESIESMIGNFDNE